MERHQKGARGVQLWNFYLGQAWIENQFGLDGWKVHFVKGFPLAFQSSLY